MKSQPFIWIAIGVGVLLLISNTASATPLIPLTSLSDQYGADAVNRLQSIENQLQQRGLTAQQIKFALSQILFESGLFTDVANYPLMNQNNYAGLTTTSGGYASYNSIADFTDAYLGFLTKGAAPIDAMSLTDFNSRLVANHYYTENPEIYYNGLLTWYNVLS
jgi:hypothetical protein